MKHHRSVEFLSNIRMSNLPAQMLSPSIGDSSDGSGLEQNREYAWQTMSISNQ